MYDVVHKPSAELFAKKKLDIDWMPGWRPLPASTPADRVRRRASIPLFRRSSSVEWRKALAGAELRGSFSPAYIVVILGDSEAKTAAELGTCLWR